MAEHPPNSNVYPKHGGYEKLLSHQVAELTLDVTKRFIERYIPANSRTRDQMEQAARSGSRNISEGSVFSATSKKIELNLTNVARASLTELFKDYEAFLRQNKLTLWPVQDPLRQELVDRRFKVVDDVARWGKEMHARHPERNYAEISANIGYIYCKVAVGLLDRQLQTLGREFEENGGFNERFHKIRTEARTKGKGQDKNKGKENS